MNCNISVAIVSDFFYPALGGVENQIKQLAHYLSKTIKKVIVITHSTQSHHGVLQKGGIKVYYLDWPYSKRNNVVFATCLIQYLQAKTILMTEQINIVHCHQTASTLALQYAIFAKFMDLRVILTEHSLYGFKGNSDIGFNWFLRSSLNLYDKIICVSRTVRNNICLRGEINPDKTVVIPNSVTTIQKKLFICEQRVQNVVKIAIVGRLVYRRGIDLLIKILPSICKKLQSLKINFKILVIGDGQKRQPLKQIIKLHKLSQKVILLGALSNKEAITVVSSCQIYLNTALTESFGIALVEASSLGLKCLSTHIGGVSEILPDERLQLVEPDHQALLQKLLKMIYSFQEPLESETNISFYENQNCCQRVKNVYFQVMKEAKPQSRWNLIKKTFKYQNSSSKLISVIFLLLVLIDSIGKFFIKTSKAAKVIDRKQIQ